MSLSPAAIGIILNETNTQVLLVKRKDVPIWVLPGGGIEKEETPEVAVIREVEEETGYQVRVERQSGEYYPVNRLAAWTAVFICRIEKGMSGLSHETAAIEFFYLDKLPTALFSVHRDWLHDALTSTSIVKKKLTQVTYWAVFKHFLRHPGHVFHYLRTRWFSKG